MSTGSKLADFATARASYAASALLISHVNAALLSPLTYSLTTLSGNSLRRMSSSFFSLLLVSLAILMQSSNISYMTYVDMGWVSDTFYFSNFLVGDFYA